MKQEQSYFKNFKSFLLGNPLASSQADEERLSKKRALAVFSSDALSSVAYATEEILRVLVFGGAAILYASLPISIAIGILLAVVVMSYTEVVKEYPNGGGAYVVANENLGQLAGLTAGAALLIDYVLTVSVSVAAGIEALTSAFPQLFEKRILLCLVAIFLITVANLRGLKESAKIFAIPTYAFIAGIIVMVGTGFYKLLNGSFTHVEVTGVQPHQAVTVFFLLRAFSSGCTAMTGVEAISNGVPAFKTPEPRNAIITLVIMTFILMFMFIGITFLSHFHGIIPAVDETVLSQLARSIYGTNWIYYFIQFTTMGILILAANTSYAGFPRLASLLAKDRYLPRQLASLGDRLVFSNGIVMLGFLAALLIILFKASTHNLIPLYAVGVFLSFTLSQAGMVKHWIDRGKGQRKGFSWISNAAINLLGCIITFLVMVIFILTKFTHGAWVIVLLIPAMIIVFLKIQRHYLSVSKQLSLIGANPIHYDQGIKHTVLIPISGVHKGVIQALRYADSIAKDVRAVYVEIDTATTARLQEEWQRWGQGIPLVVLKSPYRSVMAPFLKYVDEVEDVQHDDVVTIVIPEFVTAHWWESVFHNQTALLIRTALLFKRGKVITSVRYHLD